MFSKEVYLTMLYCTMAFVTGLLLGIYDYRKQLSKLYYARVDRN